MQANYSVPRQGTQLTESMPEWLESPLCRIMGALHLKALVPLEVCTSPHSYALQSRVPSPEVLNHCGHPTDPTVFNSVLKAISSRFINSVHLGNIIFNISLASSDANDGRPLYLLRMWGRCFQYEVYQMSSSYLR
jgi:hypothetical protein